MKNETAGVTFHNLVSKYENVCEKVFEVVLSSTKRNINLDLYITQAEIILLWWQSFVNLDGNLKLIYDYWKSTVNEICKIGCYCNEN